VLNTPKDEMWIKKVLEKQLKVLFENKTGNYLYWPRQRDNINSHKQTVH
jgi:hypothetical protein